MESKAEADQFALHSANKDCSFYQLNFRTLNYAELVSSSLPIPEPSEIFFVKLNFYIGFVAEAATYLYALFVSPPIFINQ